MRDKKEVKENCVVSEKEFYKEKIKEMVERIDNTWILNQIVRFIENIQN